MYASGERQTRRQALVERRGGAAPRALAPRCSCGAMGRTNRVLRVARTIADLEASESITAAHVAEALGYRPRTEDTMTARPVERVEALEETATI